MKEQGAWRSRFLELRKAVSANQSVAAAHAAEEWNERARDALTAWEFSREDHGGDSDGLFLDVAQDGLELLVSWGGLRRLETQLVDAELSVLLDQLISEDSSTLVGLALELDPIGPWLADATSWLEESVEARWSRSVLAERAISLFRRLDDAELACWAAGHFASAEDEADYSAPIENCVSWACEHPELFLEAERYVYAHYATLRADLDEIDASLALTQVKFHRAIEEVEAQRAFLSGDVESAGFVGRLMAELVQETADAPVAEVIYLQFGPLDESAPVRFAADSADSLPDFGTAVVSRIEEWAGAGTLSVLSFNDMLTVVLEGATERPIVEIVLPTGDPQRLAWRDAVRGAPDRTEVVSRETVVELRIAISGLAPLRLKLE